MRSKNFSEDRKQEKLVVSIGGDWNRYQKRGSRLYPIMCNDTVYKPYLRINMCRMMCAMNKGFKMTP